MHDENVSSLLRDGRSRPQTETERSETAQRSTVRCGTHARRTLRDLGWLRACALAGQTARVRPVHRVHHLDRHGHHRRLAVLVPAQGAGYSASAKARCLLLWGKRTLPDMSTCLSDVGRKQTMQCERETVTGLTGRRPCDETALPSNRLLYCKA